MLSFTQLWVMELYFGDTRRMVPQFLACKKWQLVEGCGNRVSCRNLFKKLQILPLTSQYMLPLLMFVVKNKNLFSTSTENYNIDTRQRNKLGLPQANLTIYQNGAYYSGLKIFNNLPLEIKNVTGYQISLKLL
jgi:hypothetical protein